MATISLIEDPPCFAGAAASPHSSRGITRHLPRHHPWSATAALGTGRRAVAIMRHDADIERAVTPNVRRRVRCTLPEEMLGCATRWSGRAGRRVCRRRTGGGLRIRRVRTVMCDTSAARRSGASADTSDRARGTLCNRTHPCSRQDKSSSEASRRALLRSRVSFIVFAADRRELFDILSLVCKIQTHRIQGVLGFFCLRGCMLFLWTVYL